MSGVGVKPILTQKIAEKLTYLDISVMAITSMKIPTRKLLLDVFYVLIHAVILSSCVIYTTLLITTISGKNIGNPRFY